MTVKKEKEKEKNKKRKSHSGHRMLARQFVGETCNVPVSMK